MAARRGIAGMVGIEPRDTRVDRMLRVALRLILLEMLMTRKESRY